MSKGTYKVILIKAGIMQLRERRKGRGGNSLFSVVLKNNFETFHRIQKQTPVVDSLTTK